MADYSSLQAVIDAYIRRNGVQAITGQVLNGVLTGMVNALGKGFTVAGEADPATDPGTMTGPVAYIAHTAGTYTHFDGIVVNDGEVAMLIYNNTGWTKQILADLMANATIDGNVGTPSVTTSFVNGVLTFDFSNMKGNPGVDGIDGTDGLDAGFGTIDATVDANIGTPGVNVVTSGPNTAKNMTFQFTNLKGQKGDTGVTSVVVTVDNNTGTPGCTASLSGGVLTLAFTNLKGAQGDTGVSADYPITIANNLTTDDPTIALSASMGVQLEGEITQLEHKVDLLNTEGIDLSDFELRDYTIKSDGNYGTNALYKHKIVPVNEGEKYIIFATGSAGARYAFFSSTAAPVAGAAMPLVPGTSVTNVTTGGSAIITVPSGCVAIAFYFGQTPYNYEPTVYRYYSVPDIDKRLSDVEDEIGNQEQHISSNDSGTFDVSAFSQKLEITGLSIPSGQKIRIQISGTATRDTQRLYKNSWGGNQIALPSDSSDIDFEHTLTSDITSLYFGAEVTSGGSLSIVISYDIPSSGVYSLAEEVNAIADDMENIEQSVSDIEDSIGTIVNETETYNNVSCATTPKYYKEILYYTTKGDNPTLEIDLSNIVGQYSTIRASWGNKYKNLSKVSNSHYRRTITLDGYRKGTVVTLTVYVETISTTGSCDVSIREIANASDGTILSGIRNIVNIYTADTQLEIYNKMSSAVELGNCDVHFENGTYNFDETLYDYMKNTLGFSVGFELPIGGGCRYYFHGAKLIGEYNGSISVVRENCNVIGCRMTNGDFELYDGTIVANDIIYCCHDDVGTDTTKKSHIHKHINMHYIYNGGDFAAGNYICKCIGGGTGLNLSVVIDKCILEKTTDNDDKNCVTYHGLASEPDDYSTSKILITNTYMTGGCGAYKKNASRDKETIQLIVSNCLTPNIIHNDVDYYRAWNNTTS